MKLDQRAWIPLIGIYFGLGDELICSSIEWQKYQLMCCLLFFLLLFGIYN